MRSDVARDLTQSAATFNDIVWPVIRPWFGGGELVPVESVTAQDFVKDLDTMAGIDAWHIKRDSALIRGIASRVQWLERGKEPYNTFTIRYQRTSGAETEYTKRLRAMKHPLNGWLWPALTVQAYLERGTDKLLSVGCVKTAELFTYLTTSTPEIKTNPADGNKFIPVSWSLLQENNVPVKVYTLM